MAGNTVFKDALARFKSRLNANELRQFSNVTTLDELKSTIASIQKSQEDKKEMMNLTRIRRFLEGMEQLGKVVDIFLNTSEILAFVWGPMKFLLLTASVWADSFDILLDAYESIGQHLPLLEDFEGLFHGNNDIQKVLGWIYEDVLTFQTAALQFFSRPLWKQLLKSAWKDFDANFKGILNSLKKHNDLLDRMAGAQHMKQIDGFVVRYTGDANNIRAHIDQYKMDRDERLREAERVETERKLTHQMQVLQWLAPATMSGLHESFCEARQSCPESGKWILKSDKLKDWRYSDIPNNSVLWLHGIPGAGKTVLASRIVDSCTEATDFKTTYFYCRYGDDTSTTCKGIYRGLIAQMIKHCYTLIPFCHEKMNTTSDSTLTTEHLAKEILEVSLKAISKQFIIIDGLDECEPAQRANLLKTLTGLVKLCDKQADGKPRLLLTSRNLGDIQKSLADSTWMEIQRDDNRQDLENFIRLKMERLVKKFDLGREPNLTDELKKRTLVYANGMFLYAELVMRNLENCYDRKTFWEEISNSVFPTGIEQAYNRIIHRMRLNLTEQSWQRTRRLLGWIVSAKRSLKLHELQAVLSIEPTEKYMDYEENRLRVHITECCGSLVQMVGAGRVELVHHTAREFIIKNQHVNESGVQCDMMVLCLQYLTFDCFSMKMEQEQVSEHIIQGYLAFQDYAVSKWFHHLETLINKCSPFLHEEANSQAQQELFSALDDFTEFYQKGLYLGDTDVEKWMQDAAADCESYQGLPLFEHLRDLWAHVRMKQTLDFKERDKVGIPELLEAVERNRTSLEIIATDQRSLSQLEAFYGRNHFKCPRLTCPYFYEGFETPKDRDTHLKRHERPFLCGIETCEQGIFGFASNTQLEKHLRNYHLSTTTPVFEFAALNERKIEQTIFTCPLCKKNFTRNISLKSHVDSHNGLKPFACPECGKAFTRKNDVVRHQKIHSRFHRGG